MSLQISPCPALLLLALLASIRAGGAILRHYDDYEISYKDDNSPLTSADLSANEAILSTLSQTGIPICSEESLLSLDELVNLERFWLIDPLDGTKDFICKTGEFCVCIALIEHGRPILAVIYAPKFDEMYYSDGRGLFSTNAQSVMREFRLNLDANSTFLTSNLSENLDEISQKDMSNLDSFASTNFIEPNLAKFQSNLPLYSSHQISSKFNQIQKIQPQISAQNILMHGSHSGISPFKKTLISRFNLRAQKLGSALKYCKIASGEASLSVGSAKMSLWDAAAGDFLLCQSGGKVIDLLTKKAPLYDGKDGFKMHPTLAVNQNFISKIDEICEIYSEFRA